MTFDPQYYFDLYQNKSHNELVQEVINLQEKLHKVYVEKLQLRCQYLMVRLEKKRGQYTQL